MSFLKYFQVIGNRLRILEAVADSAAMPEIRIQTRTISLQELESEIGHRELHELAKSPAELSIPFEKIFETAGICATPHEWTIERLRQWIASEPLTDMPREEVQKTILNQLSSEGAPIEAIIKDAVARDQALDSFEARMSEKLKDRRDSCRKRMIEIEAQIKALQQESMQLDDRMGNDEKAWREWKKQKREHERDLAFIASYIVDHPVITIDDDNLE
jgi:chromosome segregation ATPase